MSDLLKLDLGCGKRVEPGFVGVDISPNTDASILCDLKKVPWQFDAVSPGPWTDGTLAGKTVTDPRIRFQDESVDEVLCRHFFEHMTGPERMAFMDELWRVLKPGAKATIECPHWNSARAVMDPTHRWPPLCAESFLYFVRSWRLREKLDHYPIKCNFTFEFDYALDREVQFQNDREQEQGKLFYNNVIDDIIVVLTKRGATEETPC